MPKNKTKKNGAANRIRRTANPIVARQNRNNATNNNNGTIEYNSNNINNNTDNNNTQTQAQILRSALRVPGQQYPRKTLRGRPINMSAVKPKRVNGETYLVHKRTGNKHALAFQTRIHKPKAVYDVNSLNDGTSYNVNRAIPVQIRTYNVSRAEYRQANQSLNYKTRFNYANKSAAQIAYIQQYVPMLVNKFMNYYNDGVFTNIDQSTIVNGVNEYIASMYTTHIQGNVRPYDELSSQEKNIIDFQENIFKKVAEYLNTTLSLSFSSVEDFASQNLRTLTYIYHVFALEGLYDHVLSMLPQLPEDLNKIIFPNKWKRFYQMRGLLR